LYIYLLPENLRYYIDYVAFSRELFLDGHYSFKASGSGVHVFADYCR
jgi:antirestriction protein